MTHETQEELAQKVITFFSTGNHMQSWQFLSNYVKALENKIIYDNLARDLQHFFETHPSICEIQFNITFSLNFNSVDHELTNLNLVKDNELRDNAESYPFLQNLDPLDKVKFLLDAYLDTWEYLANQHITSIHRSNVEAAFENVLQGREREAYDAIQHFEKNKLENAIAQVPQKGRPNKI